MASISTVDPIRVYFPVSEQEYLKAADKVQASGVTRGRHACIDLERRFGLAQQGQISAGRSPSGCEGQSTSHAEERQEPGREERQKAGSEGDASRTIASLGNAVLKDAEYLITSPLRLDLKSGLVLGGVAAGIGGLAFLDHDIQRMFQRTRDHSKDDIAETSKTLGSETGALIGNAALIGTGWIFREYEGGNKLLRTALVSLESQLFAEAFAGVTKFAVGRERPNEGRGTSSFNPFHEFDRSFPSSHAARAFVVASVFADRYEQPIPLIAYGTAAFISVSRVYLNEHFATDVVAGAVLGFVIGKVLSWRHKDENRRWTVLPYVPDARGGLGMTFSSSF